MRTDKMNIVEAISLVLTILLFFASQFFILDYFYFFKVDDSLFLACFCLGAAAMFAFFYRFKSNPLYFAAGIFLVAGFINSYKIIQSVGAFAFYTVFAVLFAAGYIFYSGIKKGKDAIEEKYAPDYKPGRKLLFSFLISAVVITGLSAAIGAVYTGRNFGIEWYFPFRLPPVFKHIIVGGIMSVIYLSVLIFVNYMVYKKKISNEIFLLIILVIFAFVGKLIVINLSHVGFKTIELKAISQFNTYYVYALQVLDKLSFFIKDYVNVYQVSDQSVHLRGHPVGPVIFYWFICKFITANPVNVALIVSGICSLTVIPFYYIGKILTDNKTAAFITAVFYLLTPNSLIQSNVGIDCVIVLLVAVFFWMVMFSIKENKLVYSYFSGFFFGVSALLTFGVWHLLLLPVIYYAMVNKNEIIAGNYKQTALRLFKHFVFFSAGLALIFTAFMLFTKGNFNYVQSFVLAGKNIGDVAPRAFSIWVWGNFAHWSHYATIGVMSLFFIRYYFAAKGKIGLEPFSVTALSIMFIQFFSCMGRMEQNRQWMFLIVFAVPVAVLSLLHKEKDKLTISVNYANLFTALIFINTVLLELFIHDNANNS